MPKYWLDANVFIETNNGITSMKHFPSLWVWIEDRLKDKTLSASYEVYGELMGYDDELRHWAQNRREVHYWPKPAVPVQIIYRKIVQHVVDTYASDRPAKVADFLRKADCWIIAHAKHDRGTVVSRESRIDPSIPIPKVPNICKYFEVPCIDTKQLLDKLKFRM